MSVEFISLTALSQVNEVGELRSARTRNRRTVTAPVPLRKAEDHTGAPAGGGRDHSDPLSPRNLFGVAGSELSPPTGACRWLLDRCPAFFLAVVVGRARNEWGSTMPLDPRTAAVLKLLFGYAGKRESRLQRRGLQLAHYTTADVAAQILLKRNMWMRNASSMNDSMEFKFGNECLKAGLREHGDRLMAALDVVSPGLLKQALSRVWRSDINHQYHTYLTSLSEHRPNDDLGVLSMWRAYGGPIAGVALIFNPDFLAHDTSALAAWPGPVAYGDTTFMSEFDAFVTRVEQSPQTLAAIEPERLATYLFNVFQFAELSTKHIGFREEREWRVIHNPQEFASAWMQPTFETVRGKPEVVYHLPLQNHEGMGIPAIDLSRLLNRVIIGPCQNPYQVASTFADILRNLGFEQPADYIRVSFIPLRQQG